MALIDILRDHRFAENLQTLSVYNSAGLKSGKFQASYRLPNNTWLFEFGETPEEALEKVARSAYDFLKSSYHAALYAGDTDSSTEDDGGDLF